MWFCPGTPVSFINKIDHHDINEILLKVVLNTTTLTLKSSIDMCCFFSIVINLPVELFRFSTSFIAGLQTFLRNVVSSTSRHSEI
jgi:hypothetical protein